MSLKQRTAALAAFALVVLGAVPTMASAAKLWVSPSAVISGNGKGCTEPGFNSIQSAITTASAGSSIEICSGTYAEQLTITKSLSMKASGTPLVKLPASPVDATSTCGQALTAAQPGRGATQDGIDICGGITVKISGLAIEAAWPAGTCNDNLYGVFVAGSANLALSNSSVLAAGAVPIDGCQGGIGIEVGSGRTSPVETGVATLKNVVVEGYQKNGINVIAKGSKATITGTTVKGAGLTNVIGQNGIEVGEGAEATISKASISDNRYEGAASATGLITFEETTGPKVSNSTFTNNDIGVDIEENGTSTVTITGTKFINSKYDGVFEEEGNMDLGKDTFNGGEDGIGLYQRAGETSGPTGTGTSDKIENMSSYAVVGFSDNNAGDPAGQFTIRKSKLSNNPAGASVQHSVFSESNSLEILTEQDS